MDEDVVEAQTLDVSDSIGTDESEEERMSPVDISEAPAPQTGRRKPGKAAASKAAAPKPRTAKHPAAPAPAARPGRQPVKGAAPAARPTRPGPPAEVSEYRTTAEMLKLVSDATRLSIVDMLREGPLNVGEICDRLEVQSQPAVSHHIALLRHGRVIIPSRQGKNNYYSLTPEYGNTLARLVAGLMAS